MQQNPLDPTLPETVDPADLTNWPEMLDQVLGNLFTPAEPPLLDLGLGLWTGLAAIVVSWTGLRIAFAGASFSFWDIVRLVTGLSIPLAMLRFYAADFPGVGLPFPGIIPAGANQIADLFRGDMITEINDAKLRLAEAFTQNMAAAEIEGGIAERINAIIETNITRLFRWIFQLFLTMAFYGIFAISMAQVFWAQIAIAILIFLGPAFIPWLVFKPMAFLFWGWFRAMWTYSLYAIIAAGLMRVWCTLAITMVESFVRDSLSFTDALDGTLSVHAVAVVPLFVAALLSAIKVPELAGALVGTGGVSGGGMGGLMAGALIGGARVGGRYAKQAAGAVT